MLIRSHEANGERRTAWFSDNERHRYYLSIGWSGGDEVAFIGLNPSTATETKDDPTVAKLKRWAKANGFGSMVMLNAYGFRSTDPKGLLSVDDPNGEGNDATVRDVSAKADLVVCCWGVNIEKTREREVLRMLTRPMCFQVTKHGHPGHPLYLKEPMTLKEYHR